jgi:hypothetical protein
MPARKTEQKANNFKGFEKTDALNWENKSGLKLDPDNFSRCPAGGWNLAFCTKL